MKKLLVLFTAFYHTVVFGQTGNDVTIIPGETKPSENTLVYKKENLMIFTNPSSSRIETGKNALRHQFNDQLQNNGLKTIFYVNVDKTGNYFFLANTLSTYNGLEGFQQIKVFVNEEYQGCLHSTKADWEVIGIENKQSILLLQGKNKIEFVTEPPFYPEIDAIQLSEDNKLMIRENAPYNAYKQSLALSLSAPVQSSTQSENPWQVKPVKFDIYGNNNGTAYKNVPVVYTYNRKITLQSAERVVINTTPVSGDDFNDVDTYMYLYKIDDPQHYSYSNDNYQGLHSKIDVKLPAGDYYLVIRAKNNNYASMPIPRAGLVNVYYNNAILNEGVAISGYVIDVPSVSGTINYFTSKTNASPLLFVMNGDKMMFNTTQYTYYPPADYAWINGARIKLNVPSKNNNMKMLITCVGAWSIYYGCADIYGGFQDAPEKYMKKFPNLKSGDAILMAGDDAKYNSAAWAGGITDKNIYFPYSGIPHFWLGPEDYFENNPKRYEGAITYIKNGRGKRAVIEYAKDETATFNSRLYSVTNYANNTLHGFAYESKIGDWGRITHEYNSLTGTEEFGEIYSFFNEDIENTPTANPQNANLLSETRAYQPVYTLAESIRDGLSVVKNEKLTQEQTDFIQRALVRNINGFVTVYDSWVNKIASARKEKLDVQDDLFNSSEWYDLIEYGKRNIRESLVFLTKILFDESETRVIDKEAVSILFCNIASEEYKSILQGVYESWKNNSYTENGAYICPSYEYFTKLCIKKIIQQEWITNTSVKEIAENDDEIGNNPQLCSVSDNIIGVGGTTLKLNLPCDAIVSLQIVNNNNIVEKVKKAHFEAGEYCFHINSSDLLKGVNVCVLKINEKTIRRKIIKR